MGERERGAMDVEAKFDLLLKTIAENEKKRVAAEDRTRSDLLELKAAVDGRLPQVEKRVEDLNSALNDLNTKVEQLEGNLSRTAQEEKARNGTKEKEEADAAAANFSTPFTGTREMNFASTNFGFESAAMQSNFVGNSASLSGSIPPMTCP